MHLSIIIPTLDERPALERQLPGLLEHHQEVWISDGGSRDGGPEWARQHGAQVIYGQAQRGQQLNRGAGQAQGDVFLFLHADTRLPADAEQLIRQAMHRKVVGGGFRLQFSEPGSLLQLTSRIINLRSRWTACPLGDQAQFVRHSVFHDLGGYRPWPILEDLDFARRLKRQGPTVLIRQPVVTSARRYLQRGLVRQLLTNWLIFGLYFAGVSPHRLGRLYRPGTEDPGATPPRPG